VKARRTTIPGIAKTTSGTVTGLSQRKGPRAKFPHRGLRDCRVSSHVLDELHER
jgi:hypothetical protein